MTPAHEVMAVGADQWEIAFQCDNVAAGAFWRAVATETVGDAWTETMEPVTGRPDVAPDHWIRTTPR